MKNNILKTLPKIIPSIDGDSDLIIREEGNIIKTKGNETGTPINIILLSPNYGDDIKYSDHFAVYPDYDSIYVATLINRNDSDRYKKFTITGIDIHAENPTPIEFQEEDTRKVVASSCDNKKLGVPKIPPQLLNDFIDSYEQNKIFYPDIEINTEENDLVYYQKTQEELELEEKAVNIWYSKVEPQLKNCCGTFKLMALFINEFIKYKGNFKNE